MLKNAMIAAAVLGLLAGPSLASDDESWEAGERHEAASGREGGCAVRPSAEWLTVEQLSQKLKDRGYTVREVERSRGCYEVTATDANGVRVKFYADPATAEIVNREDRG